MLQIYWLFIVLISILSVIYFNAILFLLTTFLLIILAIYLALEVNTRDLTELNYFNNNELFDLNEEINLIGKEDFIRTSYFNCLNSTNSKSSPVQQLINRKQSNFQQRYSNLNDENRFNNETYTGDAKIDEQINDLINLVLRDFVHSWYSNISSNQEFINELKLVQQSIIRLLVARISKINKINYITTKLVDNFVQHLKLYRMAKQHLKANNIELTDDNLKEAFFNFEFNFESNRFCRNAVSEDQEFCLNYLNELTSILQYLILPPDVFNNRAIKYFVNSICINSTFYPLLVLLSDSDFINQTLISLCKSKKLNISLSESFLIIIRSCATKEELNAVLESVREEIALQRSKDAGGEDDFEIKQKLSSLCYVNSMIKERFRQLNEGGNQIDSKINFQEENNNFNCQKNDLIGLKFDFVLTNPLALTYFFEYMITINKQSYLNFYLSVEGFRLSVEKKLVSIQMKESEELFKQIELEKLSSKNDESSTKENCMIDANIDKNLVKIYDDNSIQLGKEISEQDNNFNTTLSDKEIIQLNNELKDKFQSKNQDQKLIEKLENEMQQKLTKLKEDNKKANWLNDLIVSARAEARNIYDTYLSVNSSKQHRIVVDDWMIQDLKRKIDYEELSETWFDTIHSAIYRRLREEEVFFISFKKSIHYYKLLKELGLLRSSSLKDKNNHLNIKKDNLLTQQNKPSFYIEVDNDNSSMKSTYSNDTESLNSLLDKKSNVDQQEVNNQLIQEETESDSKSIRIDAEITSTGITREYGKEYGVYCINVTTKEYLNGSNKNFKEDKKCVIRRYSDFYTFHQHTVKLFPQLSKLDLPPKKAFANMNQEFLEQRKQSLNSYLKQLLTFSVESKQQLNLNKSKLREHILEFFESDNYLSKNRPNNSNNQILTKTMNTVLNPFKSIKNKPAHLIENIAKIKPFGSNATNQEKQINNKQTLNSNRLTPTNNQSSNHLITSNSSSSLSNSQFNPTQFNLSPKNQPKLINQLSNQFSTNSNTFNQDPIGAKLKSNVYLESETNIPLRILLLLMDEIFDLKSKSFWLRRRIFNVIKQIIQTTYGNTINRKIISFINRLFSSSYIESYIKTIKKTLWPNGYRAIPSPERDKSTRLRTKIATKMLLLGIMPDDLMHVVGSETSRKSMIGLFNMLQCDVLNRRLIIVIFETFLIQLFPENELNLVFERLHSAACKHEDKIESNQLFLPYLSKMNLNSNFSSNSNSDQSSKTSPIYQS